MDKELTHIKMEIFMKGNIKMIMQKVMVFFIIKMEIEMKGYSKEENL